MNYTINENEYIAEEGYVFCNKNNGMIFSVMSLGVNDSLENYEIIERPAEPESDEVSDSEALEELLEVIDNES